MSPFLKIKSAFHRSDIPTLTLLNNPAAKSWWAALWRGLIVDKTAKHYKAMGSAIWLYIYLVLHANRTTGILARKIATIAGDMHMSERTVQSWLARLRKAGYVIVRNSGRSLEIHIQKWKPLKIRHR
jgi:DNA-binding transcriptional ArsR family regulator